MGLILLLASVCALLTAGSDLSHSYHSYHSYQENLQECQYQEAWSPIVLENFQGIYGAQCKLSLTGIGRSAGQFFHYNLTKGKLIPEFLIHNVHNYVFIIRYTIIRPSCPPGSFIHLPIIHLFIHLFTPRN